MKRLANERGVALVMAILFAALLLPIGYLLLEFARTDWLVVRNLRSEVETFAAAEDGLSRAVGSLAPMVRIRELLAGPDRRAGTSDDGEFVLAASSETPAHAVVSVGDLDAHSVRIHSVADGANRAKQIVEAIVRSQPTPYTAAAWFDLGGGASGLCVSLGADHRLSDAVGSPNGSLPAVPARSAARNGEARSIDVASISASLAASPHNDLDAAGLGLGSIDSPAVTVCSDAAELQDTPRAAGILLVRGSVTIRGAVHFAGLVLVEGTLRVAPGAALEIRGSLWLVGPGGQIRCDAPTAVVYSSEGLLLAEQAAPQTLPHAIRMVAWRQVL